MKPIFSPQLPPLPKRPLDAHKNSAGSLCIIGGSYGMTGAPALAASAAFAAGAGYVRVVCPQYVYPVLAALVPSAVFVPLDCSQDSCPPSEVEKALATLRSCCSCVIGPGLGESPAASRLFLATAAAAAGPLILDASALALLARETRSPRPPAEKWILTPHPGEAARLLGTTPSSVQADRPAAVARLVSLFGCVVVLKGAATLVCDGQRLYENTSGNAGMAKAGCGDVLAGVIGAFTAQGLGAFDAACLGVYLHGRAADMAAAVKGRGLSAEDIVAFLPDALVRRDRGPFEKGRSS